MSALRDGRECLGIVRANLYNAGLVNNECATAYSAALFVGASPEDAFEAARRHALLMTPEDLWDTQTQRRYQYPNEYEAMRKRQQAKIAELRSLPNPFVVADVRAAA